jgi:tripartite-type tricarboxylate transporter receptor subunit TctC
MAPALNDVLAGAVTSVVVDFTTGSEMVRSGMLRPLAVLSAERLAALPEVPTMAESGLPNFSAFAWQGLIAPRGTPDAVIDRLSAQLTAALAEPAVRSRYEGLGLEIPPSDPHSFTEQWQADKAFWQPLIRDLGIRMDG